MEYQKHVQEALVFSYQLVPSFLFVPWAEHIRQFLIQHNIERVKILGAGAGGPIFRLQKYLLSKSLKVHFTLTDLVPNPELVDTSDDLLSYEQQSVNALETHPTKSNEAIMMIGCFHHFDPEQARKILNNFQNQRSAVYILEVSTRNWLSVACNLLFWLPSTLSAPFIRPFSWLRILFSWIIPIFPLFFVLYGVISSLRTYSKNEFLSLANPDPNYKWEVTDFSSMGGLFKLRSYLGKPKER